MRHYLRSPFSLVVLMLLFVASAHAAITGVISGTVTDSTGAVIPGATVTLTPQSGKALTAVSGSDGNYAIRGVPAGNYSITATLLARCSITARLWLTIT